MRYVLLLFIFLFSFSAHATSAEVQTAATPIAQKLWLMENHTLPVVSLKLAFRDAGAIADTSEKQGLANLFSDMLSRGAGGMDSLAFSQQLEGKAIDLQFSVDKDHLYVSIRTLSENLEDAIRLLSLALTDATFEPQELERAKAQASANLLQKLEDPNYIASLNWNKQVFGKHPYAQAIHGTQESISQLSQQDLKDFASSHLSRSNLCISAVGDVTLEKLNALLVRYLDKLPASGNTSSRASFFKDYPTKGSTTLIERPQPQSLVLFGSEGIGYQDKDYDAASLANYILGGGGFESRLMDEIREKNGLAYSVYSYFYPMEKAYTFKGSLGTRTDGVEPSMAMLKKEMAKFAEHGTDESELRAAKNQLIGSFLLSLDSTENLADYLSFMQIENLPPDYLRHYADTIRNVSLQDVNRVAKRLFNPEKLIIIVVGKSKVE